MMENKQESEINIVRDLIELLDLTGVERSETQQYQVEIYSLPTDTSKIGQ